MSAFTVALDVAAVSGYQFHGQSSSPAYFERCRNLTLVVLNSSSNLITTPQTPFNRPWAIIPKLCLLARLDELPKRTSVDTVIQVQ